VGIFERLRIGETSVWRNRPLWALLISLFIVNVGLGIVVPILPFYTIEVGATPSQLGLLYSSYSLAQFVSAAFWGYMTDRIGARRVIAIGNIGLGISLVIFGLANQLWLLFAARLLGGTMSGAAVPASLAYAGKTTSSEIRGAAMAMLGAGIGAGFIIGPALGGFLGNWGLATPFFVSASITIVAAIVAIRVLPRSTPLPDDGASVSATPEKRLFRFGLSTEAKMVLGFFLLAVLIASFGDSFRQSTLALYSADLFGMDGADIGLMFTMMGAAYVIVQVLIVGRAVDRFGEGIVLFAGLILNGTGFGLLLLAGDFWTLTATICLQGAGMACIHTSVPSMISKYAGERSGTLMGFRTMLQNGGRVIGPVLGTRAYEIRASLPYVIGGLIYVVGIVAGIVIYTARGLYMRSNPELVPEPGGVSSHES